MAKTLEERCAKYEWKLRHGYGCKAKDCSVEEQVERFRQAQERSIRLVEQVKLVLDSEGVSTLLYPFYYAFALRLGRLRDRQMFSGEALAVEAAVQVDVWLSRGLSQQVLDTIRTQVFDIGPPTL